MGASAFIVQASWSTEVRVMAPFEAVGGYPARFEIRLRPGDKHDLTITVEDAKEQAIPLWPCEVWFTTLAASGFELSSMDPLAIEVADQEDAPGRLTVHLSSTHTRTFECGHWTYEVFLLDPSGNRMTVLRGMLLVED